METQPGDRSRTPAQVVGDAAELLAAEHLIAAGWTILARNVHVGRHELDLVAVDPGPPERLVIVEVRWRSSRAFGVAEETVDHRKRRHVRTAAWGLIQIGHLPDGTPLPDLPVRFDLLIVEPGKPAAPPSVRHHRAAF